jgi:hypothetical protein
VFAEENVTFHLEGPPGVERAGWALAVEGAVLARGEVSLAGGPAAVVLSLPKLREGVVVEGALTAEAGESRTAKRLWVFASDPWHGRKQEMQSLNLRVFDPDGTTAMVLEKAGLPFKPLLGSADGLAGATNGILILAEGLSVNERKGLARAARQAAERGARVLWLAPGSGASPLPGSEEESTPPPSAVGLRRSTIVGELDKRLAAADWRGTNAVHASMHLSAEKRRVEGEWRGDSTGWPWLDVRWPGGGRLIVCGFGVIGAWDQGPAPRYLLSVILDDMKKNEGGVQ